MDNMMDSNENPTLPCIKIKQIFECSVHWGTHEAAEQAGGGLSSQTEMNYEAEISLTFVSAYSSASLLPHINVIQYKGSETTNKARSERTNTN